VPSQEYKNAVVAGVRQFVPRVEIYFDGESSPPLVLTGDDIIGFSLLEEAKADEHVAAGFVTSNEFSLVLENSDRRFSPANESSPYYGKIKPAVMIKPFLGIVLPDSSVEEVPLGVFWTDDWQAPATSVDAKVVCYDRLYEIMAMDVPMLPVMPDTTIGAMFARLFRALGLSDDEFSIGPRLDIPVKLGWLPRGKVGQALNLLAVAGSCSVTTGRDGVINVVSTFGVDTPYATWTDNDMVISAHNPHRYKDVYSRVSIKYAVPYIGEREEVLKISKFEIPNGVTTLNDIAFSKSPVAVVDSVELIGTDTAYISNFEYGAMSMNLEITNPGNAHEVEVQVLGKPVGVNEAVLALEDTEAVQEFGSKTLEIENHLIQNSRLAKTYARAFLEHVKNPKTRYSIESRGDPVLSVNDFLEIRDPSDKITSVIVRPMRINLEFDGGLKADIDARLPVVPSYWTMISPGLYVYTQARIE